MADEEKVVKEEKETFNVHTYPLCKETDMTDDMKQEAIDVTVTAVEKFTDNYESAAIMIKDALDKKFGAPFDVVVGEAYAYSITFQENSMMLAYTNGNVGVLIWRTVAAN